MVKTTLAAMAVLFVTSAGTAYAQACLHGPDEASEQAARRAEALIATRNINNPAGS